MSIPSNIVMTSRVLFLDVSSNMFVLQTVLFFPLLSWEAVQLWTSNMKTILLMCNTLSRGEPSPGVKLRKSWLLRPEEKRHEISHLSVSGQIPQHVHVCVYVYVCDPAQSL